MGNYLVFGVNGVGKSTILERVRQRAPGIEVHSGSMLLKQALGCDSYNDLERLRAEQKKSALVRGIGAVVTANSGITRLVDTHLVACFDGDGGECAVEDMWDETYLGADGLIYVTATQKLVQARRAHDNATGARRRNDDGQRVAHDLSCNDAKWEVVSAQAERVLTVVNTGTVEDAASQLLEFVEPLRSNV
jgi:adenylate kinase